MNLLQTNETESEKTVFMASRYNTTSVTIEIHVLTCYQFN